MLNGKSSITNYRKFMMLEPKLSCPSSPSEILPLSGSLTEASSVPAESPVKISPELPRPPELSSRPPSTTLPLMFWELAEVSKRSRSELRDTISLKSAQA